MNYWNGPSIHVRPTKGIVKFPLSHEDCGNLPLSLFWGERGGEGGRVGSATVWVLTELISITAMASSWATLNKLKLLSIWC